MSGTERDEELWALARETVDQVEGDSVLDIDRIHAALQRAVEGERRRVFIDQNMCPDCEGAGKPTSWDPETRIERILDEDCKTCGGTGAPPEEGDG